MFLKQEVPRIIDYTSQKGHCKHYKDHVFLQKPVFGKSRGRETRARSHALESLES